MNKMFRNENLYREYMRKAEAEYQEKGEKYTEQQCFFLQQAAQCQSEMASISMGEERLYHQRLLADIDKKIREIVKTLNPEGYKKLEEKWKAAGNQKKGNGQKAAEKQPSDAAAEKIQEAAEDENPRWFKERPSHSFEDVSGMEPLKNKLKKCIIDSKLSGLRNYMGMENLHSYFFIGPPGCGKTYMIEAFAHELMDKNYAYLSVTGSDILSKYVGEAEKMVTKLFETAEKHVPCILFIDEIDGVCRNRSLPNLPEYASSITTSFLTAYNRINSSRNREKIIFIGATNYPDRVDNAMLDRVELIRVPLPDEKARGFAFARKLSKRVQLAPGFTYEDMAGATKDYNYRDIDRLAVRVKEIIIEQVMEKFQDEDRAIDALKSGKFCLSGEIFERAQSECLPTPKDDILRNLDEWEKKFRQGAEE